MRNQPSSLLEARTVSEIPGAVQSTDFVRVAAALFAVYPQGSQEKCLLGDARGAEVKEKAIVWTRSPSRTSAALESGKTLV